jgi:DNA-binding response OmpR family regulator
MFDQKPKYSLLYVEDDDFIRENAVEFLDDYFTQIYEAADAKTALEIVNEKEPDIIITDIAMPDMNGLALCREIRSQGLQTPIIVVSAFSDTHYLLEAVELGLVKYLLKPIEEDALFEALRRCFDQLEKRDEAYIKLSPVHRYDIFNALLLQGDTIVKLTHYEQKLLDLLIRHKDRVVTYQEIENYLYYDKGMSEDALKSLVRSLRKKITKEAIRNYAKMGYKIVAAKDV